MLMLVSWAGSSSYVIVIDTGAGAVALPPAGAAMALTGGDSDAAALSDARYLESLDEFDADLGPGQVIIPGQTSATTHQNLMAHADERNRIALLDAPDSGTVATLAAASVAVSGSDGDRRSAMFAPWVRVASVAPGTTRLIPPSVVAAGLMARSDAENSANVAAAGANGISRTALDLSQREFSDSQREVLNEAGVNIFRVLNGTIRLYGYRTKANPISDTIWLQLTGARMIMEIQAEADNISEQYVFAELDGRGHEISAYGGDLARAAPGLLERRRSVWSDRWRSIHGKCWAFQSTLPSHFKQEI